MRRLTAACVGMLAACFMIGDARSAFGQGRCETVELRPDGDGSSFGRGVSILGDWVMVGAIGDDDRGPLAGAAYLFRKVDGAWVGHAKIYATDTAPYDRFGYEISQSADAALIGSFAGAAYIFRNVGGVWTEEAKLTPSDGADVFGRSVSLSGDAALVGSSGSLGYPDAAYVFRKVNGVWMEEAKLLPDGSSGATAFGESVELDGDVAVIGDHLDNNNGLGAGAAYIFRRIDGVWKQEAKLVPDDIKEEIFFGNSVSISGDVALVGADWDNDRGDQSGSAYIFRRTGEGWMQETKLIPEDNSRDDQFGISCSLRGGVAVVGSIRNHEHGAAYAFREVDGVWVEESQFLPGDRGVGTFSESVSVAGNEVLIGAPNTDRQAGAAYVYALNNQTPFCDGGETLEAKCKLGSGGFKIRAILKHGVGCTSIEFRLDGRPQAKHIVDGEGKAVIKWKRISGGQHEVTVELGCGDVLSRTTDCS